MIHGAEIVLSQSVALIRGLVIPGEGLRIVLRDTPTMAVHVGEIRLTCRIALVCGLAIPR